MYAPITNPPGGDPPDLEAKVKALEPQLVRIFYNDDFEERQPNRVRNLASFSTPCSSRTRPARRSTSPTRPSTVATTAPGRVDDALRGVLEDLVGMQGYTNVRWVTVANEPNTAAALTLPEYEALYRALDAELVARGLRDHIKLMGGDLVRDDHGPGSSTSPRT